MDEPTQQEPEIVNTIEVKWSKKHLVLGVLALVLVSGAVYVRNAQLKHGGSMVTESDVMLGEESTVPNDVPRSTPVEYVAPAVVPYEEQSITMSSDIAKDFSLEEVLNISDIEKAYGVTFTPDERKRLDEHKFVVKNLLDTNLAPVSVGEKNREFVSLYKKIAGSSDYKERTPGNTVYVSSDVLMNLFSILSVELLKETENRYLYEDVFTLTKEMYVLSEKKRADAQTDEARKEWTKVRNYFAIPYALLSTIKQPVSPEGYWNSGDQVSLEQTLADFSEADKTADSYDRTAAFVKTLGLPSESESVVLADIQRIYDAPDKALPLLFEEEYRAIPGPIEFVVPFSLFTPRGSYTSSSLRRQYFRAVQWYQQIPFFVSSPALTQYALRIAEIAHDDETILKGYTSMSSLLEALVGGSDDLAIEDYVALVGEFGPEERDQEKIKTFLNTQKASAKIKSMPAFYAGVGVVDRSDVIDATRGMRFFSQKFIPDSYWTGMLTQGDEKPDVEDNLLPLDTSSLMVMNILGSTYAESSLPMLTFYKDHQIALDKRLRELKEEAHAWDEAYWKSNQVTSILWTIRGLFDWFEDNRASLPRFMQSPLWDAKTLMTGSGFWTEMRHTNILYAKQSFAEKGGGGDDECDTRVVPAPPYGYIEPQPVAYDRLLYAARLLHEEYTARNYKLVNLEQLSEFETLMNIIREYTKLQLENTEFSEKIVDVPHDAACIVHEISPDEKVTRENEWASPKSRAEELRLGIVRRMEDILPRPVEGPILPIKDKRAALIADIHTSDSGKLEEAIGVPRVIFVVVKDANGPRLAIGFTYSHYEFLSGERLTDEKWQEEFYTDEGGDDLITYKPKSSWPTVPLWYRTLLGTQ